MPKLPHALIIHTPFHDEILTTIFILGCIIISFTSTSNLQRSTAIVNQISGHLVSTQIRTVGLNCFKFIIESIVPSTNIVQITE